MGYYRDYDVTLTLRISTRVTFCRASGDELAAIRGSDAIDNAIGSLPSAYDSDGNPADLLEWFREVGWDVSLPVDGVAVLQWDDAGPRVETCDECTGTRWPESAHEPHCSLFGTGQ